MRMHRHIVLRATEDRAHVTFIMGLEALLLVYILFMVVHTHRHSGLVSYSLFEVPDFFLIAQYFLSDDGPQLVLLLLLLLYSVDKAIRDVAQHSLLHILLTTVRR